MRYLVVQSGRHIHKIMPNTYPNEETICGLSVHKKDTIYIDGRPPYKIVMQCSKCFMVHKERKRQAYLDAYYWQVNYWGWTKKSKSTIAKITDKPKVAIPILKEMEIPVTRLLTMKEEEEEDVKTANKKQQT